MNGLRWYSRCTQPPFMVIRFRHRHPDRYSSLVSLVQTATSFSYPLGRPTYYSLTLRQEKRRRRLYWYAYLKSGCLPGAKLHNSYVGVSATLTAEKLDTVAKHLLDKVRQTLANHYQQGGETLH